MLPYSYYAPYKNRLFEEYCTKIPNSVLAAYFALVINKQRTFVASKVMQDMSIAGNS
jgi:hypothetical protein